MPHPLVATTLLVLLAPAGTTAQEPAPDDAPAVALDQVDAERLQSAFREVAAVVQRALEVDLEGLECRRVEPDVVARALADEAAEILRRRHGESAAVEAGASAFARDLARLVSVKYVAAEDLLLVAPATLAARARGLEDPVLGSEGALYGALVEGCVQAASQRLFDWPATLLAVEGAEEVKVFNAVIAGYAQLWTRRLSRARPLWREGFEAYSRSFGRTTAAAPGELYAERLLVLQLAAARNDGERFLARLTELGGEGAVAHAFLAPPKSLEVVFHPDWFLEPDLVPAPLYEFDEALSLLAGRFDPGVWSEYRTNLNDRDLSKAFGLLGEEEVERVRAGLARSRVLRLSPREEPGSKAVVCGLYEFRAPEEAQHFVARTELLLHLKDEKFREAGVLLGSAYDDEQGPWWQGFHARLRLRVDDRIVEVKTVVAVRGVVAIEAMYQGEEVDRSALHEAVTEILTRVLETRAGARGEEGEPGSDR